MQPHMSSLGQSGILILPPFGSSGTDQESHSNALEWTKDQHEGFELGYLQ